MKSYLLERIRSFGPAFSGVYSLIRLEKNALIHLTATVFAIVIGFLLNLTFSEWLWIVLSITLVWITELLNTAIETLSDLVNPEFHPQIKIIKDLSAGAVLLSALFAIIAALFIFLPRLFP